MTDPHYGGNLQNEILKEEHDHANSAKRVNVVAGGVGQATVNINGSATIFAVVNTSASNAGNTTLNPSPNFIGIVTVANSQANTGNVTLNPSPNFIGLVTANISNAVGNATLNPSPNYIGLVTSTPVQAWPDPKAYIGLVTITGSLAAASGNVTLDPGSQTQIVGNVTLSDSKKNIGLVTLTGGTAWTDPKAYIGLVTITGSLAAASGNVTLDAGSKTGVVGNVTLSDAKTYIGLVTATSVQGTTPWSSSIVGNLTLSDPKGFIGLVTIVGSLSAASGNVTLDAGSKTGIVGNVTISDSKGFIGLTTVNIGTLNTVVLGSGVGNVGFASVTPVTAWPDPHAYIGLVTITGSLAAASGNITITDGKTYIGSVTATLGVGTQFVGLVTAFNSNQPALVAGAAYVGLASVNIGGTLPALSAGVANIGFASVTPVAAWPDPHTYIGLVTITGSLAAASGNVTLDAGSKTGIVGNLTLSDSKGFIGLATVNIGSSNTVTLGAGVANVGFASITPVAAWPDPKTYIGLVTITGSLAAASGNVTLDAGSLTGIKGNLTISDSKGFIGLTTVNIGSSNTVVLGTGVAGIGFATVQPLAAWPDPKTYIGLVTITGSLAAASGNVTLDAGSKTGIVGNVTLSDAKTYVGLVTATLGNQPALTAGVANIGFATVFNATAWPDPKTYIGLVTITGSLAAAAGNVTLDAGSITGLGAGVAKIGFATVFPAAAWPNPNTFIGLVTIDIGASKTVTLGTGTLNVGSVSVLGGNIGLNAGVNSIGFASVIPVSSWPDPHTYIGLVTITGSLAAASGNVTLDDGSLTGLVAGVAGIGFATVNVAAIAAGANYIGLATVTAGIGTQFIGLVTANSINTGTNKTLVIMPVGLGQNSLATVAVPTNAQRIKVTSLILNSNITTEIALKSGVTYLTGNASLGITLFPGGGFVLPGAPDTPQWISLPSGALVVEKRDPGGTTSKIAGHSIYFDET